MKSEELKDLLHQHLDLIDLEKPGWVNYSGLDVLSESEGGTYVMGINPGVDDSNKMLSEYQPTQSSNWSAFVDVCWKRHDGGICHHLEVTPTRVQQDVIQLAIKLGVPVQKVFATSAIFVATNNVGQLSRTGIIRLWDQCWVIHQSFLAEMRPKTIISLGNGLFSAFELLKAKALDWKAMPGLRDKSCGVFRWKAVVASFPLTDGSLKPVTVIGLPHPSWRHRFGSLAENFEMYEESASQLSQ
jgi:hypothetical protein